MTNGCPGHSRLDPRRNPNQPRLYSMSMTIGRNNEMEAESEGKRYIICETRRRFFQHGYNRGITHVARLEARSRGCLEVREDSYEAWKGAVKLPARRVTREKWRRGEI
ncbi:hypothetical protein B0H13DRAFT_1856060 [Mycena leptocephala]|nr:hypothetical protein B0H13DRAFT_1856060 [Mycena leptocephala]